MIIVPIYLAIDTNDEDVALVIAEEFSDQPWQTSFAGDGAPVMVDYVSHLVEHRDESPVLLEAIANDPSLTKTYVPVPGLKIRRETP